MTVIGMRHAECYEATRSKNAKYILLNNIQMTEKVMGFNMKVYRAGLLPGQG